MKLILLAVTVALTACATAEPKGGAARNSDFQATDAPNGFVASIAYSRYQFIPESPAVQAACRQALLAEAYDEAERRGRKIEQINEQRVRISMGRNGFTGITTCEASVPVTWQR